MLYVDIPTLDQFKSLAQIRADTCVSLYVPTTPLSQEAQASRIELRNLLDAATPQLNEAGSDFDKRRLASLTELVQDVIDDDEFWQFQANSLAVLATPDHIHTFRLANRLSSMVQVSDRFHLKPLLRAITFPHAGFVLALSQNGARLIEFAADSPPVQIKVDDMPKDAASAAGKASINDRSPFGRIQGSEGKNVRLVQYARKVDSALRPVLAGQPIPLFLAAAEPLASMFRSVTSASNLVADGVSSNPDQMSDAQLAAAARPLLDQLYAREVADFQSLYNARLKDHRAISDLSQAAWAVTHGAIDSLVVDIDSVVPGYVDDTTGRISLDTRDDSDNYGIGDDIAMRALATGATVLGVRKEDIPNGSPLAAVLRYAI
jgi:Bacterial archaeo-eukaryotic release factor family 11